MDTGYIGMQESTRSILGKYNPTDDIWKKKT
jgi:outer membrane scaffolding protein for murein synthesis (MipA/OmpV family)